MSSTLAKVLLLAGVGLGFAALVAYASSTQKAFSGPANTGQQGSFVQNEETVEVQRDAEGFISSYKVHRKIEG